MNRLREQAGYKTGATTERCATCAMRTASVLSFQAGSNDLHCAELNAPVNATGTCQFYLPDHNADIPVAVTNGIKP